jgi:MFS family permease
MNSTFAALKYHNYRLWFNGQLVSLFGTWMQNTAQGFLVYELTGSPAYLGVVGFVAGIPSWFFMLYAGVVADRIPRRTVLLITQTVMMFLAFIQAGLTFLDLIQPWHLLILAFMLGIANAFDAPARISFVSDLVDREDMTNAIALNGGMFNLATIVGPAVAGLTYAAFGPAWCFFLNGLSFMAVLAALGMMRIPARAAPAKKASTLDDLVEGFRYINVQSVVRTLIILVGLVSMFGSSFITLMPAWAVEVLGGDVRTNGLMRAFQGLGALLGALTIASLGRFGLRGKLITWGSFAFPALLLVFASITWAPLAMAALIFIGFTLVMIMNLANALVQTTVPDALRGRVMGIYTLTFFGLFPFGSLIMGTVAEGFGEAAAVYLGALILLAGGGLIFIFAPRIRALE